MKSASSKNEKFYDKKFRVKEKALKITVKKNENLEFDDLVKKSIFNGENYKINEEKNVVIINLSNENEENDTNKKNNGHQNIIINSE